MQRASRLRPVADVSPADWVVGRIGPFASGVGGLLPHGFASYARLLHPAVAHRGRQELDDRRVRWAAVASWSGRTMHPGVEFSAIARPPGSAPDASPPFVDEPRTGHLSEPDLSALCEVLGGHTRSAERCWFCLWDGYGWVQGSAAVDTLGGSRPIPPAFGVEALQGARVHLPERYYLLFEGPLMAASEMGWWSSDTFVPQSPNLIWPNDEAWCVATEIDLDSTFVGGSVALIEQLLADDRLEALRVELDGRVGASSDEIDR